MKSIPLSYHYGHKWLLKLLVKHLSADIDARQPASVTGVTVIPANRILQPTNLKVERQKDGISFIYDIQHSVKTRQMWRLKK